MSNILKDNLDKETLELLEENEKLLHGYRYCPKLRQERVEMIFNKIMEIAAKGDSSSSSEQFEMGEGEEVILSSPTEAEDIECGAENDESSEDEAIQDAIDDSADNSAEVIDLRAIRNKLGLNQMEMASKLGVSQGLVSLVESGRVPASGKLVAKLKDVLVA